MINFKVPSSRDIFLRLSKVADVVIDPYRPGVMDRLGLGPSVLCSLNPRLIYAHLSGFRPEGFYGKRAGHDINYLAVAGVLSLFGRKDEIPSPPSNILGDFAAGGHACVTGILLALLHRHSSGKGQVVEANMVDGTSYLATFPRQHQGHENSDQPRGENLLDGAAPFYEVYTTKDCRYMAVGAQEPQFYAALLRGLGLDPAKMPEQWDRENWESTKRLFAAIFTEKTMDQWRRVFDDTDACVTPVLKLDETERPHKPLVVLSASPSLSVEEQDEYPNLEKGTGWSEVLKEWIGKDALDGVEVDPTTKLLSMKPRPHL